MCPYVPEAQINTGAFIPTTNIFDATSMEAIDINTPQFKDLLVKLHQYTNNIALSSNKKISGFFIQEEFVTSAVYFNPNANFNQTFDQMRPVFRRVYDVGALPPGNTNIPHGLAFGVATPNWRFVNLYGMANHSGLSAYPINSIFISAIINGANIVIANLTAINFESCYIVLEYVKF